ncbi:MAG: hypothetical protein M0Q98_02225 [Pseudomonas sp.]|nr:hypothetical protein [Pseudomonas sp.]MDD2223086.1 hypothetical protein [Pseudomonas sp.]MDY0414917.1 hypothetical protein [Pseudomonas sp.]NLO54836.1 hypothetical protein [Gammaproteobacteria bacterium]
MYESKAQPLLAPMQFYWRLIGHALIALLVIVVSVLLGMFGFIYFEAMFWHDAFLHAMFLLGGLGAISVPQTMAGKLFLGFYGLYAGLVFVTVLGIVFAPVAHRIMHSFHLDNDS